MFSGITTFVDNSGFNLGTGSSIFTPASNTLTFGTNSNEIVRITSSGDFGIGTNSPDRKLDVSGTGNVYGKFQSTNATGAGIEVKDASEDWLIQADGGSVDGLAFYDLGRTSYRFIMGDAGQFGIGSGNGRYGTSGQVLTSGGASGAVSWTTISGTTINNNADNRVITGSGTANTLNGESGVTIDGSNILSVSGSGQQQLNVGSTNAGGAAIILDGDSNGDGAGGDYGIIRHNTDGDLEFFARNTGGATNYRFRTGSTELVRITSEGYLHLGNTGHGTNRIGGQAITGQDFDPIFKIYNSTASKWLMHLRNDNSTAPNGIFMRAGNASSNYTMYLTGGDENTPHFIVRGNGNVGIATALPDTKLHITHSNATEDVIKLHAKPVSAGTGERSRIIFDITQSNTQGARLGYIASRSLNGWGGELSFNTKNANGSPNNTTNEHMRITAQGRVRIKCEDMDNDPWTSNRGVMIGDSTTGSTFSNGSATGTANNIIFANGNGLVGKISTNGSTTTYHTSSDYRLKENAVLISDGIARLKTLKPYKFNFKADSSTTLDGFFAHEVSSAVPEAVDGEKDELYTEDYLGYKKGDQKIQTLDSSKLIPLLTAALQEAITKIETLEQDNITAALQEAITKIETLEQDNISLRARVTNLEGE
jgi:hypothetical protein